MFMLVAVGDVYLAYPPQGGIPVYLREHLHLEPPVPGDPADAGKACVHGKFPGEHVPEAIKEGEYRQMTEYFLQAPDERRHEKAGHPAVHPVRHPRIEPFAEVIIEVRADHRVAETGKKAPLVIHDVAIMEGDGVRSGTADRI